MTDTIRIFHERKKEIDTYFEYAEPICLGDAELCFKTGDFKKFDLEFKRILVANGFLLIYNVVESSIGNAIEAIYKTIKNSGKGYDHIMEGIQYEIIDNIRKNVNTSNFVKSIGDIVLDILNHHPTSKNLFSGNVDQELIKDMARQYGFEYRTDARKTNNGQGLKVVKNKRNHLAHGAISFQDCGKERTIEEMIQLKNECLAYIEGILLNIKAFLDNKTYLKKSI
jgi:hypothetical protein